MTSHLCRSRASASRAPLLAIAQKPLAFVVLLLAGSTAAAESETAPTLRVSGVALLTGEARPLPEGFEVRGLLTDEVGRPIAGAEVRVQASTTSSGSAQLRGCEVGRPRGDESATLILVTDRAGKICALARGLVEGVATLSFEDRRGYYELAERRVPLSPVAARAIELGFDPAPTTIVLDRPLQSIGVVVRSPALGALPEGAELRISLDADGAERELLRQPLLSPGETQQLQISSRAFRSAGPARLVARLRAPGNEELARASAAVLRTVTVALAFETKEAEPSVEAGGSLKINAASALGPASAGVVEARSLGRSVAAAKIRDGQATLSLSSTVSEPVGAILTLHYVGEGPGWLGGPPLEARLRPPGRSWARSAAWIGAALLAVLAVLLSWRSPSREKPRARPLPPRPRASVEVLEAFDDGSGYRGLVKDAHDGQPVASAVVSILGPGAAQRPVLAQARVQGDGSFSIEPQRFPEAAVIEVTATFHATLSAALPAPGVIELSLVSRRRALLNRLVQWAESRGVPWVRTAGEPTPAHVAHAASVEGESGVEQWARSVEQLAYGPNPPDAVSEQSIGEEPKTLRERGID